VGNFAGAAKLAPVAAQARGDLRDVLLTLAGALKALRVWLFHLAAA